MINIKSRHLSKVGSVRAAVIEDALAIAEAIEI